MFSVYVRLVSVWKLKTSYRTVSVQYEYLYILYKYLVLIRVQQYSTTESWMYLYCTNGTLDFGRHTEWVIQYVAIFTMQHIRATAIRRQRPHLWTRWVRRHRPPAAPPHISIVPSGTRLQGRVSRTIRVSPARQLSAPGPRWSTLALVRYFNIQIIYKLYCTVLYGCLSTCTALSWPSARTCSERGLLHCELCAGAGQGRSALWARRSTRWPPTLVPWAIRQATGLAPIRSARREPSRRAPGRPSSTRALVSLLVSRFASNTRTRTLFNQWNVSNFHCSATDPAFQNYCGTNPAANTGQLQWTGGYISTSIGSTVKLSCPSGYTPYSSDSSQYTVTCQAYTSTSGVWSAASGTCFRASPPTRTSPFVLPLPSLPLARCVCYTLAVRVRSDLVAVHQQRQGERDHAVRLALVALASGRALRPLPRRLPRARRPRRLLPPQEKRGAQRRRSPEYERREIRRKGERRRSGGGGREALPSPPASQPEVCFGYTVLIVR